MFETSPCIFLWFENTHWKQQPVSYAPKDFCQRSRYQRGGWNRGWAKNSFSHLQRLSLSWTSNWLLTLYLHCPKARKPETEGCEPSVTACQTFAEQTPSVKKWSGRLGHESRHSYSGCSLRLVSLLINQNQTVCIWHIHGLAWPLPENWERIHLPIRFVPCLVVHISTCALQGL